MAKYDEMGNLITAPKLLKNLYLETYKKRLSQRKMKTELEDVHLWKFQLWAKG